MTTKKIYISGPMTGLPEYNFPAFMQAEVELQEKYPGAEIVNPARNFSGRTDLPWHVYIGRDIGQVMDCDEMHVLSNWENSKGVKMEMLVALGMGLQIQGQVGLERGTLDCSGMTSEVNAKAIRCYMAFQKVVSIYEEAESLVSGDRGAAYGHPYDDYKRTTKIWMMIQDVDLDPSYLNHWDDKGILAAIKFMMAVKISRNCHKEKRDNLVDLCGYVICYKKCLDRIRNECS